MAYRVNGFCGVNGDWETNKVWLSIKRTMHYGIKVPKAYQKSHLKIVRVSLAWPVRTNWSFGEPCNCQNNYNLTAIGILSWNDVYCINM